jgi:hypothetical protein
MYGGTEQVIVKKNAFAGVVREKQNYLMYEDVDETEKFKKKRPVIIEKRPEPIFDPLDNYRYYEDLTLRDRRNRSLVKHERTSKPVGRVTPFLRDSFKKHVCNYTPSNSSYRSFSNEREERNERRTKPKKLYHPNQNTYSPTLQHQTYICYTKKNRIYPESEDQNRRESLDNYGYLRQLNPSPKRNQYKPKPKAHNNKLRGKKTDSYQSNQFGNNFNDDYDYNYKRVNKIKKPRRNDSLSSFKRRNDRSSSFGKTYRNQPRFFDDGYSCLTSSSFYCPIHGYQ